MVAPQACVAVEITGAPAAEPRAALERRCSDILGAHRCRIIAPGESQAGGPACWQVIVTTEGGDTPTEASVVLNDATDPTHVPVRRDVTFRPNDVVIERWGTLGLVIAALVTVEEHSAAEETPAAPWSTAGGGFAPVVDARRAAPPPAPGRSAGRDRGARRGRWRARPPARGRARRARRGGVRVALALAHRPRDGLPGR